MPCITQKKKTVKAIVANRIWIIMIFFFFFRLLHVMHLIGTLVRCARWIERMINWYTYVYRVGNSRSLKYSSWMQARTQLVIQDLCSSNQTIYVIVIVLRRIKIIQSAKNWIACNISEGGLNYFYLFLSCFSRSMTHF